MRRARNPREKGSLFILGKRVLARGTGEKNGSILSKKGKGGTSEKGENGSRTGLSDEEERGSISFTFWKREGQGKGDVPSGSEKKGVA